MRLFLALLIPIVVSATCLSQTLTPDQAVGRIMQSGMVEGWDTKLIGPMGDAAAVVLTKVLSDKELGAQEIDSALWILGQAFADPSFVKNIPDRQPRTALLLLKYFDSVTTDPSLKERIGHRRKYIEDHCAKASGAVEKR